MNHIIWPEGLPDEAWTTGNSFKAWMRVARMQLVQLSRFPKSRRMRWATTEKDYGAYDIEEILRRAGGSAPPGGWHEPRPIESDLERGDLHVTTLSVV